MRVYRDLFPSSRCLFMYRDVVDVAKSFYRLSMIGPSLRFNYLLSKFFGHKKLTTRFPAADGSDIRMRSDLTTGVLIAALPIAIYLDLRRRGFDITAVRYEDLIARRLDMCRVVLEFCHLPVSLAELAVKAFDVDSQANSIVSKSAIGHFKEPQLTPQIQTELNKFLKKCGVPLIGDPGIIEGTLSWSTAS